MANRYALLWVLFLLPQLGWASGERDPAAKRYALAAKLRNKAPLTTAERAWLLPKRPVLPARGLVHVHEFVGDEFYRGTVAEYGRAGFAIEKRSAVSAIAKRGRVRLVLHKGDQHIFTKMKDPAIDAVLFSGHSDVGGIVGTNLAEPGVTQQRGAKLLAMFQCIGVQTLPLLAAKFPEAQLIATRRSSFEAEDLIAKKALLGALDSGASYADVRKAIRKAGGTKNYLFPDMVEVTRHYDMDRDGRLDARETKTRDRGFRAGARDGRANAPGEHLMAATRYLQSAHIFYKEEVSNAVLSQQEANTEIVASGLFRGDGKTVTRSTLATRDGRRVLEVSLDEAFANRSKGFVGAATVYETSLAMQSHFAGKIDARAKRRAYAFAADYVARQLPYFDDGDKALAELARMKRLPALPTWDVYRYEYPHNLGSDAQLDGIERLEKRGVRIGAR